jgi:Domain of unknown function (DUF4263)
MWVKMQISLERRAEIALRSLNAIEKKKAMAALVKLAGADRVAIPRDIHARRLSGTEGRQLYTYRSSDRIRIVFSIRDDTVVVEDIVNPDRLGRLSSSVQWRISKTHLFDAQACRFEWNEYCSLLSTKLTLSERQDVLPFFKKRRNLSITISRYFPEIRTPNCLAHEYGIDGDFIADLIVGDSQTYHYILVEFENGRPDSIFKARGKKATPDWTSRFEGAYSQLVDWLWKLEDKRSTGDFVNTFGSRRAKFQGLIIIGKGMTLAAQEMDRLKWRMDRTVIDSNRVSAVSFEQLRDDADYWLRTYHQVWPLSTTGCASRLEHSLWNGSRALIGVYVWY